MQANERCPKGTTGRMIVIGYLKPEYEAEGRPANAPRTNMYAYITPIGFDVVSPCPGPQFHADADPARVFLHRLDLKTLREDITGDIENKLQFTAVAQPIREVEDSRMKESPTAKKRREARSSRRAGKNSSSKFAVALSAKKPTVVRGRKIRKSKVAKLRKKLDDVKQDMTAAEWLKLAQVEAQEHYKHLDPGVKFLKYVRAQGKLLRYAPSETLDYLLWMAGPLDEESEEDSEGGGRDVQPEDEDGLEHGDEAGRGVRSEPMSEAEDDKNQLSAAYWRQYGVWANMLKVVAR
jgi:hypothetical protein